MKRRHVLSRRTLLRGMSAGAAVALGLPLLESMLNDSGTALADGSALPRRFVVWFWGNGNEPALWTPSGTGASWQPSDMLQGIAGVKDYVSVVSGTALPTHTHIDAPQKNNPHVEGAVGLLAGGNPVIHPSYAPGANDWDYMTVPGPSIDQVIAQQIGQATALSSVEAAVTSVHGTNGPGTAVSYISHRAPYVHNPPIYKPSELYQQLFANFTPSQTGPDPMLGARQKLLDAVLDDAKSLETRLGAADKQRLEIHLEGVREIEKQLEILQNGSLAACAVPPVPTDSSSYRATAKLMADLIAAAFACDITRVASVEFSSPASHTNYPDIYSEGFVFNGTPTSFHEYEHNAGIDDKVRTALRYFVEVFADFVSALRDVPEGTGNLLDSACVLGTSEVANGTNHQFENFPLLVAGRAQGALAYPGVHVAAPGANSARIALTCLHAMGIQASTWGSDQFLVSEPFSELLV